ncbi:MAG: hypothetical protein PHH85_01970 [Candidatus Methanoperedens sp.]|nr:hypothetical protein [Candidatus Methanoperedens sp.]
MGLPKDQTILAVVAMILIAGLTAIWILTGHNSVSLTLAVSSILMVAGYNVGFKRGKRGIVP